MHKWTVENQRNWKSRLKLLIKDSRQTQAEVAREMARLVGDMEQTVVSENAFVAPLSRFVNAKGNEIDRWFEQEDSRLAPLTKALGLDSTDVLIRLRKEFLFGEGEYPVHPLFPTVEWMFYWTVAGQSPAEGTTVIGSCELTHRLITRQAPKVKIALQTHSSNVEQPKWNDVCRQLSPHLSTLQIQRLERIPAHLWSKMGLQFTAALNVLYTLLYRDVCWTNGQLAIDWARVVQDDWVERNIVKPCTQTLHLSEEQGLIVWSVIQRSLNCSSLEHLTVALRNGLSSSSETDFDPTWVRDLQSPEVSVVQNAIEQIEDWVAQVPSEKIVRYLNERRILTVVDDQLTLKSPMDACCMARLVLQSPSVDPYCTIWWSALWWSIQANDWKSIHSVLEDLDI